MSRAPSAPTSFVRGKSGHVPFWPGGLDEVLKDEKDSYENDEYHGLQTIPPGFKRGMRLPGDEDDIELVDLQANNLGQADQNVCIYQGSSDIVLIYSLD